jgi:hypothetical protein
MTCSWTENSLISKRRHNFLFPYSSQLSHPFSLFIQIISSFFLIHLNYLILFPYSSELSHPFSLFISIISSFFLIHLNYLILSPYSSQLSHPFSLFISIISSFLLIHLNYLIPLFFLRMYNSPELSLILQCIPHFSSFA